MQKLFSSTKRWNKCWKKVFLGGGGGRGEQSWGTTRPSNPDPKTTTKRRRPDSPDNETTGKQARK
ncbi:hypothetical protein HanXRQr2_Chr08g0339371 [Helianthus annuus]|uniref:Uncharacterized protein n=1 Tax=Helianthus annuus TaxID=4232 RepID=A0A9K3IEY1_HELAN|nr:hypothetical protein HanXRQr2_Chr08g0339371 [Helianthus annuus]